MDEDKQLSRKISILMLRLLLEDGLISNQVFQKSIEKLNYMYK